MKWLNELINENRPSKEGLICSQKPLSYLSRRRLVLLETTPGTAASQASLELQLKGNPNNSRNCPAAPPSGPTSLLVRSLPGVQPPSTLFACLPTSSYAEFLCCLLPWACLQRFTCLSARTFVCQLYFHCNCVI